ncbi:MAG: filamentous hemagglutinin N-terminal domain-containing protein, partial [Candidatus Omnitrophica bacterium]|nr:filamentous hemagglutinin N-terminal domain-containing protein [Candidatus Omnitrophota bacterium]
MRLKRIKYFVFITAFVFLQVGLVFALPQNGQVESGSADFSEPDPYTLVITAANNTVINFSSFGIAQNETVKFIQPSSSASLLARVNGQTASYINGGLAANGIFYLVNPNGINFGPSARLNVNSFVASTLDISTENFLAQRYIFEHKNGDPYSQIINQGIITGNNIAFIASAVDNQGTVIGRLGNVFFISGDRSTVSFDTKGLIQVEVNSQTSGKVFDKNGVEVKDAIKNSGTVQGAQVVMEAKTASNIFKNAVNQEGIVKATGFNVQNGVIRVVADGDIQVSGKMEIENNPSGQQIQISSLFGSVTVNAEFDSTGNTTISAFNDVVVNADIKTDSGNLNLLADADFNGNGSFQQAAGTVIATNNPNNEVDTEGNPIGNITIQASGASTLANINSAGDLILRQAGAPVTFIQQPGSTVITQGSLIIGGGVTLDASDTIYQTGKDWVNLGTFNPDISSVSLTSSQKAKVIGDNTFYDLTIYVPGKEVDFDTLWAITVNNRLELKGGYGNLLVLKSLNPGTQWQINVGDYDIEYVLIADSISVRGPPLNPIHSSSLGNLTNWNIDPYWVGAGSDNNWSTGANWDTGTAPTSFDAVTFDGTAHGVSGANPNKNSFIDTDFTIASLTINGYTGTLTLAGNLNVTGDITINSGTVIAATPSAFTITAQNGGISIGQGVLISADSLALVANKNIDISGTLQGNFISLNSLNGLTLLENGSLIDVSTNEAGGIGGTVEVLGNQVELLGTQINASGPNGGGTVLIGGDFQGKGTVANSTIVYVSRNAHIYADAIAQGNGGKVIVWSDSTTSYYGHISARGGPQGGDGGFVQVSSALPLLFNGFVDALDANGNPGTFILNPNGTTGYAASLATDLIDYNPGETATIMGSGWKPGETVSLVIQPGKPDLQNITLTAVADANGNFSISGFTLQQEDFGVAFSLTGTGQSSGLAAQAAFTDTTGVASVTGNWGNTATWGGSAVPTASTAVTINQGITVTVADTGSTDVAASVVIGTATGSGTAVLTFSTTSDQLTVSGTVTIGFSSGSAAATLSMVSGSILICNGFALGATSGTKTWTPSTGTVQLAATNTLPATIFTSFGNLTITGGTTSLGVAVIINNTLTINGSTALTTTASNFQLTLDGDFTNSGTFTANASPIVIAGTATTQTIAGFTTTGLVSMTKTAGTATLQGNVGGAGLTINGSGGTLNLGTSLTHTFTGVVTLTAGTLNGGSSTLKENATSTTAWNGTGSLFTASTSTVSFGGVAQTISATSTTFNNLTLAGTGAVTFSTGDTINGIWIIGNGTNANTYTVTPTLGASATLEYSAGSSARTVVTAEWPATFTSTGGVIIAGTGAITMGASKQMGNGTANVPLQINSGATLTPGTNTITLEGDFINNGTITSAATPYTIAGALATQSIGGFTTTGLVSMTKTGGTATFTAAGSTTGNVSAAGLTINGSGGTLNLGTSLTHTFTGVVTLTAGTLNGGSSTLNENATSTTAWNGTGSLFTASTSTVSFGGVAQTLSATATTFNNLIFAGSTSTKTLSSATIVNGTLTINSGITLSFGSTALTVTLSGTGSNTLVNNGTIDMSGSNAAHLLKIAANSIATFGTLTTGTGSTVEYTVTTGSQTINSVTYNSLTLDNSSGTDTA